MSAWGWVPGSFRVFCILKVGTRLRHEENGAAMVEFTLFLPLFMLVLFGMIGFGAIFFVQNTMVNAARQAVRAMSVQNLTQAQARSVATTYLSGLPFTFQVTTTDCIPVSAGQQDARVQITVPMAQAALINYLGAFTGRTLTAAVVMRKEQVCS
jgi:Flp pilus assembly protein TadG